MSPLIEPNNPILSNPGTVIIDARGGADAYQRYLAGHLPNAVFADLDTHLAAKVTDAAYGGRHPLPDIETFAAFLGSMGILPQSNIVVYDDKFAANSAARLWWMLNAIGHMNVQVLNGGLQAAIKAAIALNTGSFIPLAAMPYPVKENYKGTVSIEETGAAAKNNDSVVIDVRETPRYLGQTEPIDLVAGHIPGAINLPYMTNLDNDGKYLSPEILRENYEGVVGDVANDQIIVHCGSGVTACHTLLGMAYAGIIGPKLYVGSWSEWSRRDLPLAASERY